MKILITGGNGFLGKYFVQHLQVSHEVKSLSRKNSDFCFDLSKETPVFNEEFDLVIHSAGLAHVNKNLSNSNNYFYNTNVLGIENLLTGLSVKPKFFVLISSVSVYGLVQGEDVDENFPLDAQDPYGKSKVLAEKIAEEWCKKFDVKLTILRLPLVIGFDPPGNLGRMISMIKKGFYVNIDGGKSKKSMVLAEDVAKKIIEISSIGGTFNLTDGYNPSFLELSHQIARVCKKRKPISIPFFLVKAIFYFGDLFGDNFIINSNKYKKLTNTLTFDDSLARKSFDWEPRCVLHNIALFIKNS